MSYGIDSRWLSIGIGYDSIEKRNLTEELSLAPAELKGFT